MDSINTPTSLSRDVMHHEVAFHNAQDQITLAATVSIPQTPQKPPAVILIAGVGPYDRDCTQMGDHKLFADMARYFTQRGIAVLRYDKRGVGKSTGSFDTATTFDFARDALAAVDFLNQCEHIDTHRIGLVGHSEGGLISFILAQQSPDIAFIVSMAGAVITKIDDVLMQAALLFKASGAPDNFIAFDKNMRKQILEIVTTQPPLEAQNILVPLVKSHVQSMTGEQKAAADNLQPFALTEDNYEYWISIFNTVWRAIILSDPLKFISKVTIPVLAINGQLDFIIPAQLALPVITEGLEIAQNKDATIIAIPHQNHNFQNCKTGSLSEYGTITETIAESTLQLIADWIIARV